MKQSSERILRNSQNSVLKSMASEKKLQASYDNGIPVAKEKRTNRVVHINFNSTTKIGLFGPSGSGKTIFGKAIVSRLHKTGRSIYNAGDVDNDFQTLDNEPGISKELRDKMGMVENESRQPIPKKLFVPKFMYDDLKKGKAAAEPFTFGFQDITRDDLEYLLGEGDLSGQTEDVLTLILNDVNIDNTSFNDLKNRIEENEEAAHGTKNSLKLTVESLKNRQIISNRFRKDPLKPLEQGYAVSLGFKGFENYSMNNMYKLEFYAAAMLRDLKKRAISGDIDTSLVALWPEVHKLIPAGEDNLLKPVVEDWFNRAGRRMDMPAVLDSQAPSQIPNSNAAGPYNFLGKLTHVFMGCDKNGRPLPEPDWKQVLRSFNLLNRSNVRDWRRRINQLDTYDFLYINARHNTPRDPPVVRSLAPLVSHPSKP